MCHFHKPWRSADRGGPKKCTNDKCSFKQAGSQAEYDKLAKKKPAQKGAVGIRFGLVDRCIQSAFVASCPTMSSGLQIVRPVTSNPSGSEYASPLVSDCVADPTHTFPLHCPESEGEAANHVSGSMRINQPHCPVSGGEADDSDHDYTYFYQADGGTTAMLSPPAVMMRMPRSRGSRHEVCRQVL